MAPPDKPLDAAHLVVVHTRSFGKYAADDPDGPQLWYSYWKPGRRYWEEQLESSVDDVVAKLEEKGWRLLQRQDIDYPLEAELIFEAPYRELIDGWEV